MLVHDSSPVFTKSYQHDVDKKTCCSQRRKSLIFSLFSFVPLGAVDKFTEGRRKSTRFAIRPIRGVVLMKPWNETDLALNLSSVPPSLCDLGQVT